MPTAAPISSGILSRRFAPTACDTSVFAPRRRPMPKHTSVKPTTPARPTPASSSAPTCATNAVDASVIAENETMETVIGQARRSSALPGLSDQVNETSEVDNSADMTGLNETRTIEPSRIRQEPQDFAENLKGSLQ